MDNNFRPNHIEDYLVQLHTGQWFGWSDTETKKASGKQKLLDLGLTEEEVKALIGV
jgi:hypothetical protein